MSIYFAEVTGDHSVVEKEQELSRMPKSNGPNGDTSVAVDESGNNGRLSAKASDEALPPVV